MIAAGRRSGWLSLPVSAIPAWAKLYRCTFDGAKISKGPYGSSIVADRDLAAASNQPVMVIPRDLVLSLERVEMQAKVDQHLRLLLEALGDFSKARSTAFLSPCWCAIRSVAT